MCWPQTPLGEIMEPAEWSALVSYESCAGVMMAAGTSVLQTQTKSL